MSCFKKPASGTPQDDGGVGGTEGVESVLTMPATGIDPDWRERIDLAKRARQDGKKLREGKPIMFPNILALEAGLRPIAWCPTEWCEAEACASLWIHGQGDELHRQLRTFSIV